MFSFFLMTLITTRSFLFGLKLKWLINGGTKVFIANCIFFRVLTFFIKFILYILYIFIKLDILYSLFLSLDQNLMKHEQRS